MPSVIVDYVAGSGFSPLLSGNPWSGYVGPIGGLQLRADGRNSGSVYISFSGGNFFSGQFGTLVGSGGPTINSGARLLSGGMLSGMRDGFQLAAGDAFLVPKTAIPNLGANSGLWTICAGCDTAASGGFARIYLEMI